jgi:hypothetical protein
MNSATILDFVTLFFAGMLAGIEFVIHYGLRGPSVLLDDHAQLQLRQALVMRLRVLVPAFFAPTAVLGIGLTLLNGGTPGSVLTTRQCGSGAICCVLSVGCQLRCILWIIRRARNLAVMPVGLGGQPALWCGGLVGRYSVQL